MLKYHLFFFESLIRQDVQPHFRSKSAPNKAFFSATISELELEKERVLSSLLSDLFVLQGDAINLYIHLHQHNLVSLLDQVADYTGDHAIENISVITTAITWSNLCKHIYRTLREILTFIEDKFPTYLDTNCRVPAYYLSSALVPFQNDLLAIKEKSMQTGCDEVLLQIILDYATLKPFGNTSAPITYHDLYYSRELLKRVLSLFSSETTDGNITERLQDLLLYLNFNSLKYFHYWTDATKQELNQLPTLRQQLDCLHLLQKRVNQTPAKPGFISSKLHPSIHAMIKTWITEEIKYLKEKELFATDTSLLKEELTRWQNFKVLTTLSVAQLGNLLRLLVDSEIILNANKSELLDFISHFFTSTKQDNISPGSLRANFYKNDASVSRAVRDILLTLVNNSRKG